MTSQPNAIILKAPGTNCEQETADAFELAGASPEVVMMSDIEAGNRIIDASETQLLAIAGGFSFGDDIKSGKVMAIEIESRFGDQVQNFVDAGGMIIGICNGNQVLIRSGLLPHGTLEAQQSELTLTENKIGHFMSRWVDLMPVPGANSLWIPEDFNEKFTIHAAHAEGQYVLKNVAVLDELIDDGQIAFQYVDERGVPTLEHPQNPNGSTEAIAGISDKSGRILGMMPHPERIRGVETHPDYHRLGETGVSAAGLEIIACGVRAASQS